MAVLLRVDPLGSGREHNAPTCTVSAAEAPRHASWTSCPHPAFWNQDGDVTQHVALLPVSSIFLAECF